MYLVYQEQLVVSMYEYYVEVTLHHSSPSGAYTRSSKGCFTSTPSQAVQFAAIEAHVYLRYNEVRMQTHPGFYFYPSLFENGCIRFHLINPSCDRSSSHLSRYITATYLLIYELSQELTRARIALAGAQNWNPPPTVGFTPYVPPASTNTQGTVNPSIVTPRSAPAAWASLVATPAAPMLRSHPAPAPKGESSRQHRCVSLNPEVTTISSGSESGSGADPPEPAKH